MRTFKACLLIAALIVAWHPSVRAQDDSDQDSDSGRPHKAEKGPPPFAGTPQAWPRLDPGAMFCSSIGDLDRHFAVVDAQLDGTPNPPAEPVGCRIIQTPIPVTVLDRQSRGHTEVKLSQSPGETGWTDMFLPDKNKSVAKPHETAPGL